MEAAPKRQHAVDMEQPMPLMRRHDIGEK